MDNIIEKLSLLWAAELEYEEDIDPEDNFFELGGDSVAVIRLVSLRLRCWPANFPCRYLRSSDS